MLSPLNSIKATEVAYNNSKVVELGKVSIVTLGYRGGGVEITRRDFLVQNIDTKSN